MAKTVADPPANAAIHAARPGYRATDLPLVRAKLVVPPVSGGLLARPRLMAGLERGPGTRLTIVTGPAGAGKTALLASWVHGLQPGVAAWVTLDDVDNDPANLWRYLLAALRGATGATPDGPLARLSVPVHGVDGYLVHDLVSALERLPAPVLLVIDNVECLREGPSAESLAALLRHGVPTLRVVLGTRAQPPLPLGRLRLAGEVVEIDADDLAFTPSETVELWGLRGMCITEAEARGQVERTDGLAAAVCLAATLAEERPEPSAMAPPGGLAAAEEPLADFLRTEVFLAEPVEVRDFLLRSSVVDEVSADLANALTGRRDAPHMLDRLRRSGHFVRAAPDGAWYRYRRPFLEFLRHEASIMLADRLPGLHRRGARWYADHGATMPAIRHAVAAGDMAYAAGLLVRLGAPQVLGPDRDVLRELAAKLSPLDALDEPEIAAVFALVKAEEGDARGAEGYANLVAPNLPGLPLDRRLPLEAMLRLTAVVVARHREDWPAVYAAAHELTRHLDHAVPGLIPTSAQLRAIALEATGAARMWASEFEAAEPVLKASLVAAEHHHLDLAAAAALGSRSLLLAVRGDLSEAVEQAEAALRLADASGGGQSGAEVALGHVVLGLVGWLRGASDDARRRLAAAAACAPGRAAGLMLAGVRARLLLSQGDATSARDVLAEARTGVGDWRPPALPRDWLAIVEAELRLAAGHPVTALGVLSEALHNHGNPLLGQASLTAARAYLASASPARAASLAASVHRSGRNAGPWLRAEAWLVEALAADRLGHEGAVSIALSEALSAAATVDIVEPFVAAGPPLAALLDRHREVWAAQGPFARRLQAVLPIAGAAASIEGQIMEPITEREAAVLRYLPTLLTMNDIARELSVSPNTVKSHLRSIYRKLTVGTRRDAVHRARNLGLLRQ